MPAGVTILAAAALLLKLANHTHGPASQWPCRHDARLGRICASLEGNVALFDISRIENRTVRDLYERALQRRDCIAALVKDRSGAQRAPIQMGFVDENAFNAYARYGENDYIIELTQSVPLLLLLLFEKLLSDPQLFLWIDAAGSPVEKYAVRFIVDPADFAVRAAWDVKLTEHRSYAASTLADIMVAFIRMHELGHVLCGHVDAKQRLTGGLKLPSLSKSSRSAEVGSNAHALGKPM